MNPSLPPLTPPAQAMREPSMSEYKRYDSTRIPLGLVDFSNIRESNMIYVDKTKALSTIARLRTPIFFSRPRRFGKSLLLTTLSCLFSKGLEYFHGLDIEKTWNDKTYQIVHLDFSTMAGKKTQDFKKALGERVLGEFCAHGVVNQFDNQGVRDPDSILHDIAKKLLNNSVVLLIDGAPRGRMSHGVVTTS